jgi:hypothetical protein
MKRIFLSAVAVAAMSSAAFAAPQKLSDDQMGGVAAGQTNTSTISASQSASSTSTSTAVCVVCLGASFGGGGNTNGSVLSSSTASSVNVIRVRQINRW